MESLIVGLIIVGLVVGTPLYVFLLIQEYVEKVKKELDEKEK